MRSREGKQGTLTESLAILSSIFFRSTSSCLIVSRSSFADITSRSGFISSSVLHTLPVFMEGSCVSIKPVKPHLVSDLCFIEVTIIDFHEFFDEFCPSVVGNESVIFVEDLVDVE
jgi:hypothetical protein